MVLWSFDPRAPGLRLGVRQQRLQIASHSAASVCPANRLAGAAIPIGRVARIALLAVQIGVNPVALAALVRSGQIMRAIEIAPRIMPKRFERRTDAGGRSRAASDWRKAARFMGGRE